MAPSVPTTVTSWTQLPNGIRVFNRSAGPEDGHVLLLLHGFPTSSHQYRNLIPLLAAQGYRVIAPDLPAFGFTEIPSELNFEYIFANLATTISTFLDVKGIKEFSMYIFDYGAPVGLRIMLERPQAVKSIISQNGNAYEDGLTSFWNPLRALWASTPGSAEEQELRTAIGNAVTPMSTMRNDYLTGEPHPENIDPLSWHLDSILMERPGNKKIQVDLFQNYGTNVHLYPGFQAMLRKTQVPLLAVWGKRDIIFGPDGATAYKRDLPNARVELWEGGHFMVENQFEGIAEVMLEFLSDNGIQGSTV